MHKYKEHVKQLRNNAELLQQSLDEKVQMIFEYEARLDNAPQNHSKSRLARESNAESSNGRSSCPRSTGAGAVPLSQVKVMEQTLTLVRNELRKALGEKETLMQNEDALQSEMAALKQELGVVKHERDWLAQEKDKLLLQNSFYDSQRNSFVSPVSLDIERVSSDASRRSKLVSPVTQDIEKVPTAKANKLSLVFQGSETKKKDANTSASQQEEVEVQRDPSPRSELPASSHSSCRGADMIEEYRLLRAKYSRLSAVLGACCRLSLLSSRQVHMSRGRNNARSHTRVNMLQKRSSYDARRWRSMC